jgi:hypothetical protein
LWLKKAHKVLARESSYLFNIDSMYPGEAPSDFHHVRWFVSLAAMWNWAEIRAIRLDQQVL